MLFLFLSLGSVESVEQLRTLWTNQIGKLPEMFSELLDRSTCRIACRRLGITELKRVGSYALLLSSAIDQVKWDGLQRIVPESLKNRVTFDLISSTNPHNNPVLSVTDVRYGYM